MPPLAKSIVRQHKVHERKLNVAPADAGKVFWVGAYLVREAATGLAIPGVDAAGVKPLGVVVENEFDSLTGLAHLDNTLGADGVLTGRTSERVVKYDQTGEFAYAVTGAATPKVQDPAYLVDDNTVTAVAPGVGQPSVNGIIAGHFTRPAPAGGWFIDISRRGIA
ncbi:MAG TPA: hypothetical protein VNJ70_17820 [Thermoanaerobaculia bacterium]|nr:hypothetical protein [Thermoanaerobaculia bacterium]